MALLFGAIYSVKSENEAIIINKTGLIFIIVFNQVWLNAASMLNVFSSEKIIINKELYFIIFIGWAKVFG